MSTTSTATNTTTAITIAGASAPIEPRDMDELRALAVAAASSKFYGAASPEQALMLLVTGRDLGLSYSQALRAFHVVQGRPVLSSAGMVAVCLRASQCEYFRVIESTDASATVEVKRRGDPARRITFALDDARRAGLDKRETWKAYPSRMLLARAQAFAAREVFPDLLLGLYDADEVPVAAPAPAAPRGPVRPIEVADVEVIEAEDVPREWAEAIDACETLEQLAGVGAHIKAEAPAHVRGAIRREYLNRLHEIKQAALRAQGINPDAEDP